MSKLKLIWPITKAWKKEAVPMPTNDIPAFNQNCNCAGCRADRNIKARYGAMADRSEEATVRTEDEDQMLLGRSILSHITLSSGLPLVLLSMRDYELLCDRRQEPSRVEVNTRAPEPTVSAKEPYPGVTSDELARVSQQWADVAVKGWDIRIASAFLWNRIPVKDRENFVTYISEYYLATQRFPTDQT